MRSPKGSNMRYISTIKSIASLFILPPPPLPSAMDTQYIEQSTRALAVQAAVAGLATSIDGEPHAKVRPRTPHYKQL